MAAKCGFISAHLARSAPGAPAKTGGIIALVRAAFEELRQIRTRQGAAPMAPGANAK